VRSQPQALLTPAKDRRSVRLRPHWWTEAAVIVWLCWVYDAIANLAPLRQKAAMSHAGSILHFERALHIDPEAAMDHWMAAHRGLALVVADYYDNAHFVVTLGLIGLLWWKYPSLYRPLRNSLVAINVVGMAVFWVYPTAPPRLYDPAVYTDVVALTHAIGSWHSGTLAHAANQFAAMPSLHVAWACWSALAAHRILGGRRGAVLVWAYPALTVVSVLSTGNHFVLDSAAGVVTFAICSFAADRWQAWWTTLQAHVALRREATLGRGATHSDADLDHPLAPKAPASKAHGTD